jgi:arginyl-tRNA synthetase
MDRLTPKEISVEKLLAINTIVDQLRTLSLGDASVKEQLQKYQPEKYLLGDELTIADLLLWDYMSRLQITSDFYHRLDSLPELQRAKKEISHLLSEIPLVDHYKFQVVEQVVGITGLDADFVLENVIHPKKDKKQPVGDVAICVPALKLPGNPIELCKNIASQFKTNDDIVKVTSQGPFCHFFFSPQIYTKCLKQVLQMNESYGRNYNGLSKFAVVEFSSPNIAKPFHAGHLRSTIIGSFVTKLLNHCGWETTSINYLGDWGKQYGLLAVGFEKYGSEQELINDPIKHLFDVYVSINKDAEADESIHDQARLYFKRMEDGDENALALWSRFRELSIHKYKDIYKRINVEFDIYSGESQYSLRQMKSVVDELKDKKLLTNDGGALLVDLKEYQLGTAVIGKTDGSMLYLSRDIAAAIDRKKKFQFDRMVYVVGTQQDHHFRQLFKILELSGHPFVHQCQHVAFGLIKSKDGNMSTRKGTVVFLEQILDHVQEEMHGVMQKNEVKYKQIQDPVAVSDIVGISAIIVQDLSARRVKDYEFDWNRMLAFEGDTGPYLQYAHARMCSIERGVDFSPSAENFSTLKLELLKEPKVFAVLETILEFPQVIQELEKSSEPCQLVNFCLRLAHVVSSCISEVWVQGQEKDTQYVRLAVYKSARICLGVGLRLLGLKPLERM